MKLTRQSRDAWYKFLNNVDNVGHAQREILKNDIDQHVNLCMESAINMTKGLQADLPDNFNPKSILEIGSSAGLNCYALKQVYPVAKVYGIEPEKEAVNVAISMDADGQLIEFLQGIGEDLPFKDNSVDLIIIHTVIEHVQDVKQVIKELSRVLTETGIIHLNAPNYVWPHEPHLRIWTLPFLGKKFVKLSAIMQGKKNQVDFINHLKFVTPFNLEKEFIRRELIWINRAEIKVYSAINNDFAIKKYKKLSAALQLFDKLKLAKIIARLIIFLGLYPSVMYTLCKNKFQQ